MSVNLESMITKRCSSPLLPAVVRGCRFTVQQLDHTIWEHMSSQFKVTMYQPDATQYTMTISIVQYYAQTVYNIDTMRYTTDCGYELVAASVGYSTWIDQSTLLEHSHDWSIAEVVFRFLLAIGDKLAYKYEPVESDDLELEELDIADYDPTLVYLYLTDQL